MNRCKQLLSGLLILFALSAVPIFAQDADSEATEAASSEAVNDLPLFYLRENLRLIGLADNSYSGGEYDESYQNALDAIKFAQMSDDYVLMLQKMPEAQNRLAYAEKIGAEKDFPQEYEEASGTFANALDARTNEDWGSAAQFAQQVLDILAILPEQPLLPAQYLVRTWNPEKDCLWNIAAKPEIYGDPFQWKVIYDANKSKFPQANNPNIIEPGMVLDIPSIKGEARSGIMSH